MIVWIKINCVFHGPLKFKIESVDRKNILFYWNILFETFCFCFPKYTRFTTFVALVIHCQKMDKRPPVLNMSYSFSLLVTVFVNIYGNKSTCFNHRGGHVLSLNGWKRLKKKFRSDLGKFKILVLEKQQIKCCRVGPIN